MNTKEYETERLAEIMASVPISEEDMKVLKEWAEAAGVSPYLRDYPDEPNYSELYTMICTRQHGEQIFVFADGSLDTADAQTRVVWNDGQEPVATFRAEGDFDRSSWGISRRDEDAGGGFIVDGLDGCVFDSSDDALRAAVAEFGITAEAQDALRDEIERQAAEAAA